MKIMFSYQLLLVHRFLPVSGRQNRNGLEEALPVGRFGACHPRVSPDEIACNTSPRYFG